jgi:hypothetical protein
MRQIWIAILMMVPCMFARGDERNCKEASGGIVTNFLTESGTVNFPNESGKTFLSENPLSRRCTLTGASGPC